MGPLGWDGLHGHAVWHSGTFDLVGVLMGYHGACDIFHHLWHSHGHVRLLCADTSGERVYTSVEVK